MFHLYSLLIRTYGVLIRLGSFFSPKAKSLIQGRSNQTPDLETLKLKWAGKKIIWIHAASYGEFEMAKPIIAGLNDLDLRFLITFHSPSGYEQVKLETENAFKAYIPLDLYHNQKAIVDIIQPDKVVFIKYEFWFNLLKVLSERDIPYYFTSLHLNKESYLLYKWMRPLTDLIRNSQVIFCHNEGSRRILEDHGFSRLKVFGDTRILQVQDNKPSLQKIEWQNEAPSIALGSLLYTEIEILRDLIKQLPNWNFIIAPHDIDNKAIAAVLAVTGGNITLFSSYDSMSKSFLIIDTMGDLKNLYANCDVAYIGGGFAKGPHNVLEAIAYGTRTICGPNIKKFPLAQQLVQDELLTVVKSKNEVPDTAKILLTTNRAEYHAKYEAFVNRQPDGLELLLEELRS